MTKNRVLGLLAAGFGCAMFATAATAPKCDPDNGGIKLPEGFCALVAADNLGPARHITVAPNGDIFVALQGAKEKGGVVALHDADGDGRFEQKEHIGEESTTGVALRNGYIYLAHPTWVERFKLPAGQIKPTGPSETVVKDFPAEKQHEDKGIAFDGKGGMYLNVGAPSNACQKPDRTKGAKGQDPCPILEEHGGIWKFDENKIGQTFKDGTRFATGLRQMPAITWHDGALYIAMNNRDQLDTFWPEHFTAQENADRPSEPLYKATAGSNFGWPYCFYDYGQKKLLTNPEYGGDGKSSDRCDKFTPPAAAFPAHWAPVAVTFYEGKEFPSKYKNGAFIAFHGSWNRAPLPMAGYNVTFQPFKGDKASGDFEVFASNFTQKDQIMRPNDAVYRPDGVAQAPDGSLYITDSQKGRVWRVIYQGKK